MKKNANSCYNGIKRELKWMRLISWRCTWSICPTILYDWNALFSKWSSIIEMVSFILKFWRNNLQLLVELKPAFESLTRAANQTRKSKKFLKIVEFITEELKKSLDKVIWLIDLKVKWSFSRLWSSKQVCWTSTTQQSMVASRVTIYSHSFR